MSNSTNPSQSFSERQAVAREKHLYHGQTAEQAGYWPPGPGFNPDGSEVQVPSADPQGPGLALFRSLMQGVFG